MTTLIDDSKRKSNLSDVYSTKLRLIEMNIQDLNNSRDLLLDDRAFNDELQRLLVDQKYYSLLLNKLQSEELQQRLETAKKQKIKYLRLLFDSHLRSLPLIPKFRKRFVNKNLDKNVDDKEIKISLMSLLNDMNIQIIKDKKLSEAKVHFDKYLRKGYPNSLFDFHQVDKENQSCKKFMKTIESTYLCSSQLDVNITEDQYNEMFKKIVKEESFTCVLM